MKYVLPVRLAVAPALTLLLGCAPTIRIFRGEPLSTCPGAPVTLTWDGSTKGTLTALPPQEPPRSVAKAGVLTLRPAVTTRYRLELSNGFRKTAREIEVYVLPPATVKVLGHPVDGTAHCDGSFIWLTWEVPASFWDADLRVGQVMSSDGRRYHVEHDGVPADLDPGAPSNAFLGKSIAGLWTLKTPQAPGESCASGNPRNLMVSVASTCKEHP